MTLDQIRELAEELDKLQARKFEIPSRLEINIDELEQISERFALYAHQTEQTIQSLEAQFATLKTGNWHGNAVERFNAEMTELVLPNLRYLRYGLDAWRKQIARIAANVKNVSELLEARTSKLTSVEDVKEIAESGELSRITPEEENPSEDPKKSVNE
jgi:WXG100 family type VII secretion target